MDCCSNVSLLRFILDQKLNLSYGIARLAKYQSWMAAAFQSDFRRMAFCQRQKILQMSSLQLAKVTYVEVTLERFGMAPWIYQQTNFF